MQLSRYYGNNYHFYFADINIEQNEDYPTLINILLNNNISAKIKLKIIQEMKEEHIQESLLFAKHNKNIENIFQAVLVNEGAWSLNFSKKDSTEGEINLKKEKKYRDELFLYFFNKFPTNLIQQTFLDSSNILTALIVHELPLSLKKALQYISIEDKLDFFKQNKINFKDNSVQSLYYNIFNQNNREIIDILIEHDFDLNMIDYNNQNISFYINNKELLEYLISKGFIFDLNFTDGKQNLKSFIKENEYNYDSNFLLFIENQKSLLPFDLEENLVNLLSSYEDDTKTIFKKKLDFFYENTKDYIYDNISIKDIVIFHFGVKYCNSKNEKSSILIKFLEKKDSSYPKDLEPILNYCIYKNNKDKIQEVSISNENIIAFLDRIEYIISIHGQHFITNYFLENIFYTFFNIFRVKSFDNSLFDNRRYNTLANLLFLNNDFLKFSRENNYSKLFLDICEKKNINPPLINLLNIIFNELDERKVLNDIQVHLLNMDFYLIKLIQDKLTILNYLEDSNNNSDIINSYLEKYMINYNLTTNINHKEKTIKRL